MENGKDPHDQGLLNVAQAAAFLGMCESTVRTWAHAGRLAFVKFGESRGKGAIRFRIEDLEKFVMDNLVPTH